jgi:DNA-binding response OmpR family regulator
MAKPLDMDLLLVRIQGLLARSRMGEPSAPEVVRWGTVSVVPDEHRAALCGKEVPFTHLEFKLLLAFLRQPNRVLTRSWLLQTVWESSPSVSTRTVDKHVESLRKKLPPFGKQVETVVGIGYLFRP